jgi:succinate dehydrogenase/fumarate reductase flavoprotein subunit
MQFELLETDVLVIGGGLAGATAALKAKESGISRVMLVSKGKMGKDSVSTFAAGVFQPAFPEDDKDALVHTYASADAWGGGLCDTEWLRIYLEESYQRAVDMDKWGVEWVKTSEGQFQRQLGRWNLPMAMFRGPQMMEAMSRAVMSAGIKTIGHTMIVDLLTEDGAFGSRVVGAVGFEGRTGEARVFKAKAVILAAGGCAFKGRYVGHGSQTGDGAAMAYRAGARLGRFETGDIHHTTATTMDIQGLNMFTGLGGRFLNSEGERFMLDYDPQFVDSASMALIAEASAMEARAGRAPIYLDMTHFTPEQVRKIKVVLPFPAGIMQQTGIINGDRIVKKMEWAPTFMGTIAAGGGVCTNIQCETTLPALFACGDAMARPKHFPKALAGAALTGYRAGVFAAEYVKRSPPVEISKAHIKHSVETAFAPLARGTGVEANHLIIRLNEILLPYEVIIISRADRLAKAIAELEYLRDEQVPLLHAKDAHYLRLEWEVKNMVLAAEMYLRSRLIRQESRDGCLREDYPYTDNVNWLKWTTVGRQADGTMKLGLEDVENTGKAVHKSRYLYPVFETASRRGIKWG